MATDRLRTDPPPRSLRDVREDIAHALESWLSAFGLPAPDAANPKDLRGQTVAVAKFSDEATVQFFFPRRTLIFQQRLVRELGRKLNRRGAQVLSVQLTPEDYARWCDAWSKTDTAEQRFQYATRPPP